MKENINIYIENLEKYIKRTPYAWKNEIIKSDREINIKYVLYCINKIKKEHNENK